MVATGCVQILRPAIRRLSSTAVQVWKASPWDPIRQPHPQPVWRGVLESMSSHFSGLRSENKPFLGFPWQSGGMDPTSAQGNKILHAARRGKKKKTKPKAFLFFWNELCLILLAQRTQEGGPLLGPNLKRSVTVGHCIYSFFSILGF